MKLDINLTPRQVHLLLHWASVSRTLNEAKHLLGIATDSDDPDGDFLHDCARIHDELVDLTPVLDALLAQMRSQLRLTRD